MPTPTLISQSSTPKSDFSYQTIKQRIEKYGVQYLSDSELLFWCLCQLANIDDTSLTKAKLTFDLTTAATLTKQFFADFAGLEQLQYFTRLQWQQLGDKNLQLASLFELALRSHFRPTPLIGQVYSAKAFGKNLQARLGLLQQEVFVVVCLNSQNTIICQQELFRGTLDAAMVHPREVMNCLLRHHAAKFIIVHNHPSNVVYPSQADVKLTERISDCAQLFGIELLDHFVIGRSGYFSFAQANMLKC